MAYKARQSCNIWTVEVDSIYGTISHSIKSARVVQFNEVKPHFDAWYEDLMEDLNNPSKKDHFLAMQKFKPEKSEADKLGDLIEARDKARSAKNFQEADRIRDIMIEMGYNTQDNKVK